MAYSIQNFKNGIVLSAEHLNHIEQGLVNVSKQSDKLSEDIKELKGTNINLPNILEHAFETHLIGENLVDSSALEVGIYYLRGVKTIGESMTTAWIDVDGLDVINASGRKISNSNWSGVEMYYINAFDADKQYIDGSMDNSGAYQYTVPSGAKYLTVSYVNITYDNFTIVAGTKRPGRYVYSGKKTFLAPSHYGVWCGKKWGAMGDSLTEYNLRASKNYIEYIAETTGISPINLGVSGTGYRRGIDNSNAFYNRVATIGTDIDVITIFGSINDLGGNQTLGTINDNISNDTVFGYVNATIDRLFEIYPSVKLGIISPTPWKDSRPWDSDFDATKYSDGLKEICHNRGIPFLDLYHCSGLRPWETAFQDIFYKNDIVNGINAGCHPDEDGHALIAPRIKAFLETLII